MSMQYSISRIAPMSDEEKEAIRYTLRASSYGVLVAKLWCRHCQNLTRVAGVWLPARHETLEQLGRVDREWIVQPTAMVPTHLETLGAGVLERIRSFAPRYELVRLPMWGEVYQNHCEQCGALHADRELYIDHEGALDHRHIGTDAIELHRFEESFLGRAADHIIAAKRESDANHLSSNMRKAALRG